MNTTTTGKPAPRFPLSLKVGYRKNYSRESRLGTLKNVSLSGAFLQNDFGLIEKDKLILNLNVAGREREVHARVIWKADYGCGIEFIPSNNQDKQIVDDLIYFVKTKRDSNKYILDGIFSKVT